MTSLISQLSLEKTASEAIVGLAITNANYEEAISILKTRFGNKQMIVNKHIDDLINMAPVYSNNDLRGMRQLYDLVEVHVRGRKALEVPSESYGSLLSWELDRLLAVMQLCIKNWKYGRELHREITIRSQTHHSERTSSIGKAYPVPHHYFLSQIVSQLVPIANNLIRLIAVRPFLMHKPEEIFLRRPEDVMCVSERTI